MKKNSVSGESGLRRFFWEPGKEMNKKEYQNALKITEDRIRELVDNNKYLVKDDDGTIRIILPEKSCEKLGTEEFAERIFQQTYEIICGCW